MCYIQFVLALGLRKKPAFVRECWAIRVHLGVCYLLIYASLWIFWPGMMAACHLLYFNILVRLSIEWTGIKHLFKYVQWFMLE